MSKDPGGFRRGGRSSEEEAAHRIQATKLEHFVLWFLVRYGPPRGPTLCCAEIHNYYMESLRPEDFPPGKKPMTVDYFSPRLINLVRKRLAIEYPKEPRANRSGNTRSQLVYAASEKGMAIINGGRPARPPEPQRPQRKSPERPAATDRVKKEKSQLELSLRSPTPEP